VRAFPKIYSIAEDVDEKIGWFYTITSNSKILSWKHRMCGYERNDCDLETSTATTLRMIV